MPSHEFVATILEEGDGSKIDEDRDMDMDMVKENS